MNDCEKAKTDCDEPEVAGFKSLVGREAGFVDDLGEVEEQRQGEDRREDLGGKYRAVGDVGGEIATDEGGDGGELRRGVIPVPFPWGLLGFVSADGLDEGFAEASVS